MVTALFPTISNPPTFGTILGLRYIEDLFEKIFVVVYDKPRMINTYQVVHMLDKVLCKNTLRYSVITSPVNFEETTVLPEILPKFDKLITDNPRVYTNFAGKGYKNLMLIPRPIGWDDTFHRIAYKRSMTLERVINSIKTIGDPEGYVKKIKEK